jgi:chromosomal replication initiation ATPase DnaA
MAGYWCKLWLDTLDDPKMYDLSDNAQLAFYQLLMIAKRLDEGGFLPTIKEIRFITHNIKDEAWWKEAIQELMREEIHIIVEKDERLFILNFEKRQQAADTNLRSQTYRKNRYEEETVNKNQRHGNATEMQRKCNETVMERDRENTERKQKDRERETESGSSCSDSPVSIPESAIKAWNMALGDLRGELPKADYTTWIDPLRLVNIRDGTFVVQAVNEPGAEWVRGRCVPVLSRILTGRYGQKADVEVTV